MSKKLTTNTFDGAMVQDSAPWLRPGGSWEYALNAINKSRDSKGFGLVNEESNKICGSVNGKIVGSSFVESENYTLLLTDADEIWIFYNDTCKVEFVASAEEFCCKWNFGECEYHSMEVKQQGKCNEINLYLSSKCEYYTFNITELLDSTRKAQLKKCIIEGEKKEDYDCCNPSSEQKQPCGYSCDYFKLFKCACAPRITATVSENGGFGAAAGAYQFAVQLEDNDGSTSNWGLISNPVNLGSENNIGGEGSLGSINIDLSCLSCKYDKVNIAVISTVNQVQLVEILPSRHYNGNSIEFTYYGQKGRVTTLDEITIKRKTYLRGQNLIQEDGRLFLYNIRQEKNLHYQPKAWDINVELVEYEVTAEQQAKHQYKSLMRGERYLFAIVFKYCDGTYSSAFLLSPSGGGTTNNGTLSNTLDVGDLNSSNSLFIDNGTTGSNENNNGSTGSTDTGSTTGGGTINIGTNNNAGVSGGGAVSDIQPISFDAPEYCRVKGNSNVDDDDSNNALLDNVIDNVISDNINSWDTDINDFIDSTKCDDCSIPGCCGEVTDDEGNTSIQFIQATDSDGNPIGSCEGCDEDTEAASNDGPKAEDIVSVWADNLSSLSNQQIVKPSEVNSDCPNQPETEASITSTIKGAASQLINIGVDSAERIESQAGKIVDSDNEKKDTQPSSNDSNNNVKTLSGYGVGTQQVAGDKTFGHDKTDCCGNQITSEKLREVSSQPFKTFTTTDTIYPDTKDCQGDFLWGNKATNPVELFEVPCEDELPIVVSYQSGVVSALTPDNYELGNAYVRPLGVRVSGVVLPTADELPKPLCENEPYKIVMVPRDHLNKHVLAKGLATSTFLGKTRGATYAFPRHGVNSFEEVDRFVDEDGSRQATGGNGDGYNFHSLDTSVTQIGLDVDTVVAERFRYGNGWRHGLYAEGVEPDDVENGQRIDQRGARQSVNLNKSQPIGCDEIPVSGITYAPANSVTTNPAGITHPLMNMYRESSVYFQPSEKLPDLPYNGGKDGQKDGSFVGDTMIHSCPINYASAWYVSLRRDAPNQYGDVSAMRFVDTGLTANKNSKDRVHGPIGDVYIGPHTFKRTGYVSNKVGDTHTTSKGDRTICDTPEDWIFQQMGQWYPTKLPISNDLADAKNYAGLHNGMNCEDAANQNAADTDVYFPKVQKTMVAYWGEFTVNPYMRATGAGSQKRDGQVYYPKLKDLQLDSAAPTNNRWEDSWLNRFYCEVRQPSRTALRKKALIRTILDLIAPAGALTSVLSLESVPDTTGFFYIMPLVTAFWWFANRTLFREDRLNELLGIPGCKTDSEGGETEDCITQFEDNYYGYNSDYHKQNIENVFLSMNDLYNTCDCDDCLNGDTTNEVFYSNKQILNSDIDAYKNFRSNNYLQIPQHSGKLKKMFKYNGKFFGHTTEGIHLVSYKLAQLDSSLGQLYLGGDLMIQPFQIMEGVEEGYAGIQDPNAAIVTKYGYSFVDAEARKVYMFDGNAPKEISMQGMELFFKDKLAFCNPHKCRDERADDGVHYTMGWDPRYDRLLLTKKDGSECSSFTISYSPEANKGKGGWVSFHSYIPDGYLWDRHDMYSFKGSDLYKHNIACDYQVFYGQYYPHMIQFSAIVEQANYEPFKYHNTVFRTEAEKCVGCDYIRDIDQTFNKIAMWNATQGTGTLDTIIYSDNWGEDEEQKIIETTEVKLNKVHRKWQYNNINDYKDKKCYQEPTLVCDCDCQAIPDINEGIHDCEMETLYQNRVLFDDYLNYRYTLDSGDNELRLKTIYVDTHGEIESKKDK